MRRRRRSGLTCRAADEDRGDDRGREDVVGGAGDAVRAGVEAGVDRGVSERAGNSQDANAAGDGQVPPVTAPMRADCSLPPACVRTSAPNAPLTIRLVIDGASTAPDSQEEAVRLVIGATDVKVKSVALPSVAVTAARCPA